MYPDGHLSLARQNTNIARPLSTLSFAAVPVLEELLLNSLSFWYIGENIVWCVWISSNQSQSSLNQGISNFALAKQCWEELVLVEQLHTGREALAHFHHAG